ncbi:flagellar hook-basal body complex protein FliE [Ornithinibacillus bavariensis]|uniref:Flagellar hook-basal body complex protein FliE n=1 Tax=Ornithinibacillus bavariensis TaxID=545502 RepID=A0A919X597_9BACI|nr:flagellar hook-basal body complex protein FliE [Ornithinibacillus bavariensis]GIO26147.1 flagellar hook-basal body complex protein FliE [Ornithinibacillus bavariensis]
MNLGVNSITNTPIGTTVKEQVKSPGEAQASFANVFKNAINDVNDLQNLSDKKTEALALGQINDLHDVMITAQKASITLEATVEIQRKVIDAYNEIMRMQV